MKNHNLFIYLWLILAVMTLSSCRYYMKEESHINNNSVEDEWLIIRSIYRGVAQDNYIVLRHDSEMWHLNDLKLSDDQKILTAKRAKIKIPYQNIIDGIQDKRIKGYVKSQKDFINQVHFFVKNYDFVKGTEIVSIGIDDISKLEIYQHAATLSTRRTTTSIILAAPISTLALFILLLFGLS